MNKMLEGLSISPVTDKKSHFEKVQEFAEAFEVKSYDGELDNIFDHDSELVKFRFSLIDEEVNELLDAVKDKDFVEVIDAIADCIYVIMGMYEVFNINPYENRLFHIYILLTNDNKQHNIMHLLAHETENYIDSQKPMDNSQDEWYALYSLSILAFRNQNLFDIFTNQRMVEYRVSKIVNQRNILSDAIYRKDLHKVLASLEDLLYYTYNAAAAFNIDVNKAFDIVHLSNMSKLCGSLQEAEETVTFYKAIPADSPKYYDSPTYRKSKSTSQNKWIIYNKSSSKVLKNINYIPACFQDIL